MTIYQKATGKVEILNARERAPLAATEDMFLGDPELSLYGKKENWNTMFKNYPKYSPRDVVKWDFLRNFQTLFALLKNLF